MLTCSNKKYGLAIQMAWAGLALLSPFPSLCRYMRKLARKHTHGCYERAIRGTLNGG